MEKGKINTRPFELYGYCTNDEEPNFEVNMWIQKGNLYKADPNTLIENVIDGAIAFQWEDSFGNTIIPNQKLGVNHIKNNRFHLISAHFLN